MKLGLEVDPQADHPPLGSDRNPRFYLLRNTRLVASDFFSLTSLKRKDLNLILIGDTMDTCPRLNRNLSF